MSSAIALSTFGKKPSEPAALSGFNFSPTSGSGQSMSESVLTGVDNNWIGYVIYILDSERITKVCVELSVHFLVIGLKVPLRRKHGI